MILGWIGVIFFGVGGIVTAIMAAFVADSKIGKIAAAALSVVIGITLAGLCFWWMYYTEGGARAQKTLQSETHGGLYRTVKVYDFEGDLLQEYEGKFDVDENQTEGIVKVKFDLDGKRHVIYCSSGTVVIDEMEERK